MRGALALCLGVALIACAPRAVPQPPDPPTFAAAASLRHVMPDLIAAWGGQATVSYGGSGTLRRQVEAGAPIDAVVFAGGADVDSLISQGLADPATRERIATNRLVLAAPTDGTIRITWQTLAKLPSTEKLAVGEPGGVPAGRYTKSALEDLGSWAELQDRVVFGGDVARVLAYARRGEVAVAAVYATDVRGLKDVIVLDEADWEGAPTPEVVSAAITDSERGRALLSFLTTSAATAVFQKHGFSGS